MPYAAPIVSPKAIRKYGDKYFKHPVGTGAFKFISWKKGEAIVLKKNNDYWGEKAKVKRIVPPDHQHARRAARRRREVPPAARDRRRLEHERDDDAAQGHD